MIWSTELELKGENFHDRADILEKAIYNIKFNKAYFEKNFNDKFDSDLNKIYKPYLLIAIKACI